MSNRRPSLLRTVRCLLRDLVDLVRLGLTSRAQLAAENLFLRKQVALYQERRTKPRRPNPATRVTLVLLARWLDWRALLTVVQPDTLIRWHRWGWRLFWRWKSRAGRPPIPIDLQRLIITMARANPTWGEERIADEFRLKLGLIMSPRTVGRYLRRLRPSRGVGPPYVGRPSCGITPTRSSRVTSSPRSRSASASVCVRRARGRHAPDHSLECDRASDGGLDDPTVSDRDHGRDRASLPDSRPRCDLRPGRRPRDPIDGAARAEDARANAAGECVLRAADRDDPAGMSGLADPVPRTSPARDPARAGHALQPGASACQPRSRDARAVTGTDPARAHRPSPIHRLDFTMQLADSSVHM